MKLRIHCFPTLQLSLIGILTSTVLASYHHHLPTDEFPELNYELRHETQTIISDNADPLPASTRAHWMRRAKTALLDLTLTPCPSEAFGTAIVNHTSQPDGSLGELICIGANQVFQVGNPTLHGEVAAINNCTTVLSAPPYSLSPGEITAAWHDLTLYTTAEACTMCTSAIRWAGFREYVYATSVWTLIRLGWAQIPLGSGDLLNRDAMGREVRVISGVLENETDPLFGWQFRDGKCPHGCIPAAEGVGKCVKG